MSRHKAWLWLVGVLLLGGCTRAWGGNAPAWQPPTAAYAPISGATPSSLPFATPVREPGQTPPSPTPNPPRPLPTLRAQEQRYQVQPGDTLAVLARRFEVSVQAIAEANHLTDLNTLSVGQVLTIPAPAPAAAAPAFKILPDAELVASPSNAAFDVKAFVAKAGGFLATYQEDVHGTTMRGDEMLARVARDYSVNPRLLLALLEYQSGWVTHTEIPEQQRAYPFGWRDPQREGLWRQLHWAANELNRGYYLWRVNALGAFVLADGLLVRPNPSVNAGTAAVQHFFALVDDLQDWQHDVGPEGLAATYLRLFGYPFDYTVDPLVPPGLTQPPMQLPFEPGVVWYFTGGPHSAWGDGSAWAALDFAPSDLPPNGGCQVSKAWAVAVADGLVVRAADGVVMLDLDGDGYEQTGWDVLYLHIADEGRVAPGTYLHAGERIGHPSCEGGLANATHLHIARKYNGEWISADRDLPWVLDGWVSSGTGRPYDGFLRRGQQVKEACQCREAKNSLSR
ncbi:MAG TPA: LysM peptidoglycan-binding domain-containing protein [Chloroflexi bacterium]|nr:LysM peptidoglycan-binding domain-containing protein [Chloroflexota bacterium]